MDTQLPLFHGRDSLGPGAWMAGGGLEVAVVAGADRPGADDEGLLGPVPRNPRTRES